MAAGRRDRLIRVERSTAVTDGYGGETLNWTLLCRAWASVNYGQGSERRAAGQERASISATFRVPTNSATRGVTAKDRIVFEGEWDVTSNVPFERSDRDITAVREG